MNEQQELNIDSITEELYREPITYGDENAPIYVVCEPSKYPNYHLPASTQCLNSFLNEAIRQGFKKSDFYFIQLCEPIDPIIKKSKAKTWKHVLPFAEALQNKLSRLPKRPIVTMGDLATRAVVGRSCAITKVRGTLLENKVYPILSPSFCHAVLEQMPLFKADIQTLKKLSENDFDRSKLGEEGLNYYWCTDIQHILDAKPQAVAIDTETTGLRQSEPGFDVLTIQICMDNKSVAVVPLHKNFYMNGPTNRGKLFNQVKELCENPKVRKIGHNINYETGALAAIGIELKGILADTQLMAWCVDENMQSKSLDDVVRRWVPDMAGYNDQLNIDIDKSDMLHCDPEKMLPYAGGDALATWRAFWVMWEIIKANPRQYELFMKLKMPGLKAFEKMSRTGIKVDKAYLEQLKIDVKIALDELYAKLIDQVPKAVIRKHLAAKKELTFTRHDFVRDILFSNDGFKLKPVVFTKGTRDGPKEEQVASTSAKDHLPYFSDLENAAGDFVRDFIEFSKLNKLYTTYVTNFDDNYVYSDGRIHPQFNLHITVTGRSSSRGPNAQNFPSRGPWAKRYKKLLVASPGYKFISADLSQIELRLIAWESRDPVMLAAYRDGKDIHKITAMAVSGHTEESWALLPKDEQKLLRYRAKAVNFGLCYGMGWKKFRRFAKTDYGVDLTDEQAEQYYKTYHRLYRNILKWHSDRTREAGNYGYVTSLHGSRRNVPSIFNEDKYIRSQAARQAINSPIQGFGSDLGVLAIARLAQQCDPEVIRPVAFIHDDIILEVKDGHEADGVNTLLWVLNNAPLKQLFGIEAPIPILAEPDVGVSLGEMYELYDLNNESPEEYRILAEQIDPKKPTWWNDSKDVF